MNRKLTVSNILIIISAIATILATFVPSLYMFGINKTFLNEGLYHIYFIQFFIGTFLHGGFFHLFFNSFFIYYFGNIVEGLIGRNKFIIFFIFTTIFIGVFVTILSNGNTIGISGFCMALLSYYTLELRSRNDMEYKGGITAIIVNVGIGFIPGVSLYGHLFGAIAGVIFYLLTKDFFRRKYVGLDVEL